MAYATPFVTYALIAACVLMFLGPQKGLSSGLVVGGGGISQQSLIDFALAGPPVANGDWWRMFTSMFLHGSIIHLGFNMYALWIFGPAIERRFGPARYLALYFTAGLWGSAGALILSPNGYTVGASGAIFGLMGAFVAIARVQGSRDLGGVGALIGINLVFTFAIPGISIGGHLGGPHRRRRLRDGVRADRAAHPRHHDAGARGADRARPVRGRARRRRHGRVLAVAVCLPPGREATLAPVSGTPKTGTRLSVLDHKYGSGPPLTIGVEEEYMLLDSGTLELGGSIDDVLAALPDQPWATRVTPELFESTAEVATGICSDVDDARRDLTAIRRGLATTLEPLELRIGSSSARTRSRCPRTSASRRVTGTATCSSSCSTSPAASWCSACTCTSPCPIPRSA